MHGALNDVAQATGAFFFLKYVIMNALLWIYNVLLLITIIKECTKIRHTR